MKKNVAGVKREETKIRSMIREMEEAD